MSKGWNQLPNSGREDPESGMCPFTANVGNAQEWNDNVIDWKQQRQDLGSLVC